MRASRRNVGGTLVSVVLLVVITLIAGFAWGFWQEYRESGKSRRKSRGSTSARESEAEEEPAPLGIPGKSLPASVTRLVKEGDDYCDDARKHLRKAQVRGDGWPVENRKALELFEKAHDRYRKARDKAPNDRAIRAKITRTNQFIYGCRKDMPLGG